MFEVAELGHTVSKSEYKEKVSTLRTQLLLAQQQLQKADFPVIIIISGVDGSGKGDVINLLNEWLDTRYMQTTAFSEASDEERERPRFWRYWRTLPAQGGICLYVGSWYSEPLAERVHKKINEHQFHQRLRHIQQLEKLLSDDGGLIIKCWLHLKKDEQKKRLKQLQKDPDTQWRVTDKDRRHLKLYDDFMRVAEQALTETSTPHAPWLIIDGSDIRYSSLAVGQHILNRLQHHFQHRKHQQHMASPATTPVIKHVQQQSLLDAMDLTRQLDKKDYQKQLDKWQGKISRLARQAYQQKKSSLLLFEGWDAAGKGGVIRRLTHAMDARQYQVIPIAVPTDEERAHHYLWRFWRHIPRAGQVTIYDRSWYGRVLVERVEGFASALEWQRAYAEIVDFEQALAEHGILLMKFWLHIDKDEQLKRFKEREQISYKKHKITEEDYRNREKWDEYKIAVNEMIIRTSTQKTPWTLLEGNNKYYARIKVLQAYAEALEKMLSNG